MYKYYWHVQITEIAKTFKTARNLAWYTIQYSLKKNESETYISICILSVNVGDTIQYSHIFGKIKTATFLSCFKSNGLFVQGLEIVDVSWSVKEQFLAAEGQEQSCVEETG